MPKLLKQFPEIYRRENDSYVYFGDDGTRFCLVAGQNGVTEQWIQQLKDAHRAEYNASRRALCIRWDGEKHASRLLSLDAYGTSYAEEFLNLVDPAPYGENNIIARQKISEFYLRFAEAWESLSVEQKQLIIEARIKKIPQTEIARREGVDHSSIRDRLRIIDKKLEKIIPKNFFRK